MRLDYFSIELIIRNYCSCGGLIFTLKLFLLIPLIFVSQLLY
jgi:hypothetical protein